MNEKLLEKRMNKMEKAFYEKVFLKTTNINDVLKTGFAKHIKFGNYIPLYT